MKIDHLVFNILLFVLLTLSACKKKNEQVYRIEGKVFDAVTGAPLSNVSLMVEQQVVVNGTYNNNFSEAASATSDNGGNYQVEWDRATINALRISSTKSQFISQLINLRSDDLSPGVAYTQNIYLHPEATLKVQCSHSGVPGDRITLRLSNALFDCICCNTEGVTFFGNTDTSYQCKSYGDYWLKYRKEIRVNSQDTIISDSIFVPRFETAVLDCSY